MSFEESFSRLEQILEEMNSGEVALDASLKLYEEADGLIAKCTKKLTEAEKRIETLMKNREGEVLTAPDGQPQTEPWG